jgi:hypothetical protein
MILPLRTFNRVACLSAGSLACCLVSLALDASAQSDSAYLFGGDPSSSSFLWIPSDEPDWTRHFHIGAVVGLNISANFSERGEFNISGNNAAAGIYDDGYVQKSGNAFGQTSLWGYNNASQYNPAGSGTLAMHSSTSYSTAGSSGDDGGPFPGFDMVYGDNLWYWKHARVGWELGFSLLPINIEDGHAFSAKVNQSTYIFDTGGIVVPDAPYRGGLGGPAVSIPNTPESITTQELSDGTVTGGRSLDVMLYTIRFGPSFYWDLNDYFGMSLGAGPALGIVSGNYSYNETVAAGGIGTHNTGAFSTTDVTFGGYVNATVMYHIINDADFYLSAQYMPMGDVTISNGGRSGQLNLGGQIYVSLGINWPF